MSNVKQLRGQVRQIVKELLPEILVAELVAAAQKQNTQMLEARLAAISKHIQATLDALDPRSKDMSAYMVRNSAPQAPTPKESS